MIQSIRNDLNDLKKMKAEYTKNRSRKTKQTLFTSKRKPMLRRLAIMVFCVFIMLLMVLWGLRRFLYGSATRRNTDPESLYDKRWFSPDIGTEDMLDLIHIHEHKITNESTVKVKRLPGLEAPTYINMKPVELVQIRRPAVRKMRPEDTRAIRTFGCLRDGCRGLAIEDLLDRNWQMRFRAAQSGDTYKSINYRVTFLLTDTTQLNHMQKVRPDLYKNIYDDYEGKCYLTAFQGGDAIGGNKGMQLKVKETYTKKFGCKYNDLGISPMSYRLYLQDECLDLDRLEENGITWLLKPETGSQGQGITFHSEVSGVKSKVPQFFPCEQGDWKPTERYLVQEYLEKPLLLKKCKFDVRVYMLVASSNPFLVFYHEGYLRRALAEYSAMSKDRRVYLTNTHFQSMKKGFKLSDHIWPFYMMQDHLRDHDKTGARYVETMLNPYIKKVALFIFQSARKKFKKRKGTFHIFGIDFMIDASYHPWFIESNGYPGFTWSINFDTRNMVEEYFNLGQQVHENPHFYTLMRSGDRFGNFEMIFNELEEERTGIVYNPCQEFKNNRAYSAPLKIANKRFARYTGKTGNLALFKSFTHPINGLERVASDKVSTLVTQSNFFKQNGCVQKTLKYMPATYRLDDPEECQKFFSMSSKSMWVLKPANSKGGEGVTLFTNKDDLKNDFGACDAGNSKKPVVVQRFISDRLLFNNKWFDMKVFVLVSTTQPYLVFYHRGYLRSSQIASVGSPRKASKANSAEASSEDNINKEEEEGKEPVKSAEELEEDEDDQIDLGLDALQAEREQEDQEAEREVAAVSNAEAADGDGENADDQEGGDDDSVSDENAVEEELPEEILEPWAPSEYNTGDQWSINEHFMTFETFQDSQAKANLIGARYVHSIFDTYAKRVAEMVFRSGRESMLGLGNITRANNTFQLFSLSFMLDTKYRIFLTSVREVEKLEDAYPPDEVFAEDKTRMTETLKGLVLETNDMPMAFARMRRGDSYADWRMVFSEFEEKQRKDVREYDPCTEFRRDLMVTKTSILKNAWLHNYAEKRHAANKRELNKYIFQKWESCKHRPTKEMQSSCVRNTISYRYKIYLAKENLQYQDGYVEMRIKDLHSRAAAGQKQEGA